MAARQRDRYKIFEAKPALGGNLITRGSADNCGLFNYTTKRDFRRDLDVEIRREGHDYFYPNLTLPIGGQPFPSLIKLDSLTYAAGTVTATRISGQWFEAGETVIITGATDPLYNGSFTVLTATGSTFTYAIAGTPTSPDLGTTLYAQADEAITLIALARRPNGQIAVIAGSKRRLYRYYALEDPDYISRDPADYPAGTALDQLSYWSDGTLFPGDQMPPQAPGFWTPPGLPISQMQYVDTNPGYWIVIGSGFSLLGHRWETVSINGYMVFNNGVDLLCTYRVEEMSVVPIYELREQGIARINTISEINGILMGGDITEIEPDAVGPWFQTAGRLHVDSLTFAAGVVTATMAAGVPFTVGESVIINGAIHNDYNGTFIVVTVPTPTTFTYAIVGSPVTPDTGGFIWATPSKNLAPYGVYPDNGTTTRTQFRVIWGVPGEPRRWGPIVLGEISANTNVLQLDYAVQGFDIGQNITIVGAGPSHAGGTADNLTGNIIYINGPVVILDSFASTSVVNAAVQASDMIGSIVGFEDLQDDGSAILKMLPLADQLVIYKDTSIFLGQYLGNPDQPFAFAPRRIQKEQSLFYRHTVWLAETPTEMFHIYAGRNSFYRFDLTNQQPMILAHFESMSNIFYEQATLANTERIFAAENGITHEILWVYPVIDTVYRPVPDKMILWDYKQDTISTSAVLITAAATVRKPLTGPASGAEEDWCLYGTSDGAVLLYGKTNINQTQPDWNGGNQIFFRRGATPWDDTMLPYDSVMTSGLGSFGNDYGEKDVRAIVFLMASQSPNTAMVVQIIGAQNADGPYTVVGTKSFANIIQQNLLPIAARRYYFQSSITVSGQDNPCRMVGTVWNVAGVDSRSLGRA